MLGGFRNPAGLWVPAYHAAAVHRLIAEKLEAVERGEIKRLLIMTPPRIGKSELVSVRFPAWYLGRHPDRRVIAASHTADLAYVFGRAARNTVESAAYGELFPGITTATDSSARDRWDLKGWRGGYVAAGVNGPLTGSGGYVAIVDDPISTRKQADSPTYREDLWKWFNDVLRLRLESDQGAIIVTHTRWHPDDLAGRLLAKEPGEWEVLRLPALADREDDPLGRELGESIWPEVFSTPYYLGLSQTDGDWEALFMQNPVASSGTSFKAEWWEALRFDPSTLASRTLPVARWLSWDTGLKDKEDSDYTACTVFELMPDYRVQVREVYRERMQFPDLVDAIEDMAQRWNIDGKLRGVVIEDKVSGTSAYQTLMKQAPDWLKPLLIAFEPMGSKSYRAAQAAVWCKNGCVILPWPSEAVPWLVDFELELFQFPTVANDDQVDSFSQGILYLENLLSAGFAARLAAMAEDQADQIGMVLRG